jgi:hypothetical protein
MRTEIGRPNSSIWFETRTATPLRGARTVLAKAQPVTNHWFVAPDGGAIERSGRHHASLRCCGCRDERQALDRAGVSGKHAARFELENAVPQWAGTQLCIAWPQGSSSSRDWPRRDPRRHISIPDTFSRFVRRNQQGHPRGAIGGSLGCSLRRRIDTFVWLAGNCVVGKRPRPERPK